MGLHMLLINLRLGWIFASLMIRIRLSPWESQSGNASPVSHKICTRKLDKLTFPNAITALSNINWKPINEDSVPTVDEMVRKFASKLIDHVNDFLPSRVITVNLLKKAPWISHELNESENHVRILYRRCQ